jgi:hypothetical protein
MKKLLPLTSVLSPGREKIPAKPFGFISIMTSEIIIQ